MMESMEIKAEELLQASLSSEDDLLPFTRERSYTWPLSKIKEEDKESESSVSSSPPPGNRSEENLTEKEDCAASATKKSKKKKGTEGESCKKPNPWGKESYSDLITLALESHPEKRMQLCEIYQWFIENNSYFSERSSGETCAGWKNSIRHNLSLHSRFMRIQNEGAGKSSWWVINPDAKPGKASRRRAATLETKTLEKKRGRVKKKVEAMRQAALQQGPLSAEGVQVLSPAISDSSDPFYDGNMPFNEFRDRSGSNLSNYSLGGSSNCINRLSPSFELGELLDNPTTWNQPHTDYNDILGIFFKNTFILT